MSHICVSHGVIYTHHVCDAGRMLMSALTHRQTPGLFCGTVARSHIVLPVAISLSVSLSVSSLSFSFSPSLSLALVCVCASLCTLLLIVHVCVCVCFCVGHEKNEDLTAKERQLLSGIAKKSHLPQWVKIPD